MRTEEEMDLWIWSRGLDQWITDPYSKSATVPHELDYLRGMHNCGALAVLSDWLSRQLGLDIRLRTMWQDKHVYVKPKVGGRRELADIAVITQRLKAGNVLSRAMWLLQAKVAEKPTSSFRGSSSRREIELFEGGQGAQPPQTPGFDLLDRKGVTAIATFPPGAFNGPHHWSFLTLHRDPKVPVHEVLRDRWPGSNAATPVHKSFCGSLVDVINGVRGMPVSIPPKPGDEWSRLFQLLMAEPSGATVGHAVSAANPSGAVMQLSTLQLAANHDAGYWRSPYYLRSPHMHRFSIRSSFRPSPTRRGGHGIKPLFRALQAEAFGEGDNSPPQEPVEWRASDEPGPGFPLTVFIDIGGND